MNSLLWLFSHDLGLLVIKANWVFYPFLGCKQTSLLLLGMFPLSACSQIRILFRCNGLLVIVFVSKWSSENASFALTFTTYTNLHMWLQLVFNFNVLIAIANCPCELLSIFLWFWFTLNVAMKSSDVWFPFGWLPKMLPWPHAP